MCAFPTGRLLGERDTAFWRGIFAGGTARVGPDPVGGQPQLGLPRVGCAHAPGTEVQLQTRTGDTLGEIVHYFKKDGTEISEAAYNKLLSIFRGETVSEESAGADWEPWSVPYDEPGGSPITSPSPREFLKVRATLRSAAPDVAASLSGLRLNFAEPVARRLLGEVVPSQVDRLGAESPFFGVCATRVWRRGWGVQRVVVGSTSGHGTDV